ncbi:hypothetical protein Cfor_08981, partial [Coptotermes formosanus]
SNPCQHPVIILQDVHFTELESLLCFVYKGEVNIEQDNLPALLRAAETLQIRGLSGASEQVKEKMAVCTKKNSLVPPQDNSQEGPPPVKRQRSFQQSQSPPLPDTPLALTPTSRPIRSRHLSTSSVEPWEQPQQPNEPEFPPKVEPRDSESCSPVSHILSMEEPHDDSTDVSLGTTLDLAQAQGKRAGSDAIQMKGSKSEGSTFHADPNYDPTQASKNFPYPPFPCPFCDRAYTSWGFRRRHIKAVHTQSPRLSCKWCLQVLPSHSDWEQHVTSEHNLSPGDAHNGLLILEEAHMVLQIPNPTRLDTFVSMIKKSSINDAEKSSGSGSSQDPEAADETPKMST